MQPDDTNTNPLDAAVAVLLDMLRPDPVNKECTPAPWASASHEGAEL